MALQVPEQDRCGLPVPGSAAPEGGRSAHAPSSILGFLAGEPGGMKRTLQVSVRSRSNVDRTLRSRGREEMPFTSVLLVQWVWAGALVTESPVPPLRPLTSSRRGAPV